VSDVTDPIIYYHLLRSALALFQQPPAALSATHYQQALTHAQRSYALESKVIASAEAAAISIPTATLDAAMAEVQCRYPDTAAFDADLKANRLDRGVLRTALQRERLFDAVLQQVSATSEPISDAAIAHFYAQAHRRFTPPERRAVRQILITINPDYPENRREHAAQRIQQLHDRLAVAVSEFATVASQHSECPSALNGGALGVVTRGTLYPALDSALFALTAGAMSGVVESEMGFHLLLCERILPAHPIPLQQAAAQIRHHLEQQQRRQLQQRYLATL